MRKVFLALALVTLIVSSTMLPEVREQAISSFAQLRKSQVGKNILTAIQLELTSENQENIVTRIITLLNELLTQTNDNLDTTIATLDTTEKDCDTVRTGIEGQVKGKEDQITEGNTSLPNLKLSKSSDEVQKTNQDTQVDQAKSDLSDAISANDRAVAAFQKSTRNHNAMITALTQARALIITLKTSAFLEKPSTSILAQIQSHTTKSLESLANHNHKDLFLVLMQMSQEVAVQADQELVNKVIEIIDDLLRQENQAVSDEQAAETQRQDESNIKISGLNKKISDGETESLRLANEISSLSGQIDTLVDNLKTWNQQLTSLQDTLSKHNNLCTSQINGYKDDITSYKSQIDVIKQVIDIFESNSIQDIKSAVDDLQYTEN